MRFAAAALRSASSYARLRARHRDAFPLADAAGILGVDTRKVLDFIVSGELEPVRLPDDLYVRRDQVYALRTRGVYLRHRLCEWADTPVLHRELSAVPPVVILPKGTTPCLGGVGYRGGARTVAGPGAGGHRGSTRYHGDSPARSPARRLPLNRKTGSGPIDPGFGAGWEVTEPPPRQTVLLGKRGLAFGLPLLVSDVT